MNSMKNTVLMIAGFTLFAFVAAKIGWGDVIPQLRAVSLGLPLIIALSALRLFLQTSAWATALRAEGIPAYTGDLMGIRLASQGAGYISVLGPAISEPMKIRLVGSDAGATAVATLVDTGTYWFASSVFGIIACLGAALLVAQSRGSVILLAILAASFVTGLVLIARPKPLLTPVIRRLGLRAPRWLRKGEEIETMIRSFASRHPRSLRRMFGLDFTCQVLLAAEVASVFLILNIPVHAGTILMLEAANRGMKMLTGWMPARIGAEEGTTAGVFAALGLSSASGLALALTRRMRDLLACAIGFTWLVFKTKVQSSRNEELVSCRP